MAEVDEEEEALRELVRSLERFPSLFSLSRDAVGLYRRDGRVVVGNAASRALIREEFTDFHSGRHIVGLELKRAQEHFQTALSGQPVEFETVLRGRDGEPINVLARLIPAFIDGKIVGVFGTARDITAQRRAEAGRDESRQQFRSLFEQHPDSISMVDAGGRYCGLNAAGEQMLGYRCEEVQGRTVSEIFPSVEGAQVDETVDVVLRTGKPKRYERWLQLKDGKRLAIEGAAVPIVVDGAVTGLFFMSRDVTDRKRIEESLALLRDRKRSLQRRFVETGADPDYQASSVLAFAQKELDFESSYVVGIEGALLTLERSTGAVLTDAEDPLFRQLFLDTAAGCGLFEEDAAGIARRSAEAGASRAFCRSFVGVPLDVGSRRFGALGFASRSVTEPLDEFDREFLRSVAELVSANAERVSQERRLQGLAHYDALTNLPNRRLLSERFERGLESARRRGENLAVYFVDVDKFKAINDTHGHLVGDEVLRTIARRLLKACRSSDTVARLGGDEFVVLQSGTLSGSRSEVLAARIRAQLEAPCDVEGLTMTLSIGIGISVFPRDGCDQRTLLRNADAALYAAKAAGPGSIRPFGAETLAAARLEPSRERRTRHVSAKSLDATRSA